MLERKYDRGNGVTFEGFSLGRRKDVTFDQQPDGYTGSGSVRVSDIQI